MVSSKTVLYTLPIFLTIVWNFLDANPSLFWYDQVANWTGKWQHSSLQGKTVWVTGASSGIGASIVCGLMKAQVKHVIVSSRNRDRLQKVADQCQQQSNTKQKAKVSIVPYDASNDNPETIDATVQNVLDLTNNHLDIVILNAGIYQNKPALQTTKQERDNLLRVNYQAPIDLTHSILQHSSWIQQKQGHIVVVTSIMAHGAHGLSSTYAATKAALRNYYQSLSSEEYNWLRVDVTCPGGTDTGMWTHSGDTQPTRQATMSSKRVAHLILTGVAGPQFFFFETWVANFPNLLWVYLRHWTPTLHYCFVHLMAYIRIPVWEHEKIDVIDVPVLLHRLALILLGRYP